MSRKSLLRLLVVPTLLVALFALALAWQPSAAANGAVVRDQYIVTLHPGANPHMMAAASGGEVLHVYEHALNGFSVRLPARAAAALGNNPNVLAVVPDRVVTLAAPPCGKRNQPPCPTPEPTPEPTPPPGGGTQVVPTGILRINGDVNSTLAGNGSGSVNVDVAVIDTGVDIDHPDLNVVGGKNCARGNSYDDGNGHGTHVAGTIGAVDNDFGVVGVAPGARIWAVRVLDNSGSGTWAGIICGIDWVTARADTIEVANMSLGGTGSDSSCNDGGMHQAICNSVAAGVTYVVAAGNESDNSANHVPAAYDEVITVSALADFNGEAGGGAPSTCRADEDDTLANFSNFGADVDIIAPGVCIESTWKGGGYNSISGTSMASPHVAGAAALYKANNPGASPNQVKSALQTSGNTNWNNVDDGDNIKEKLLDVGGY